MDTVIAVGLGNPGAVYEGTRHNVGFMVAEEVRNRLASPWKPGRGEYLFTESPVGTKRLVLVKPLTYMNNSGGAVLDAMETFPVDPEKIIVVVDDFALRLGTLRVRKQGSDGGHNGLRSLIYHLQSTGFPRIRCGIGKDMMPPKQEMSEFVLSPFDPGEQEAVQNMVRRAADALEMFVHAGADRTMSTYNK